ncbi:MAG TPA: class I SAM-dependent methyltransferase [Terracidiphilus sp.]|nr:class I SAM-dependent methyltransferase [Terracidiphilus sp.]
MSQKESMDRRVAAPQKKRHFLKGLAVKDGLVHHPFDLEYGVRTSGLVAGRHLLAGHRHDRYTTAYYAVAPSVFQGILIRWRRLRQVAHIDDFTFIDVGAGMGRAMLLAAEYPFRTVIGVELNPTLARIGRGNMALWRAAGRARAPLRMICRDVVEFDLPPGPCVAFLFNPFGGPVLRRALSRWNRTLAHRSGQLDILYVNNEQESILEKHAGFKRLFHGKIRRSHTDTLAERKILNNQPDGEYAAMAWEDCSIYRWVGKAGH